MASTSAQSFCNGLRARRAIPVAVEGPRPERDRGDLVRADVLQLERLCQTIRLLGARAESPAGKSWGAFSATSRRQQYPTLTWRGGVGSRTRLPLARSLLKACMLTLADINRALDRLGPEALVPRTRWELPVHVAALRRRGATESEPETILLSQCDGVWGRPDDRTSHRHVPVPCTN